MLISLVNSVLSYDSQCRTKYNHAKLELKLPEVCDLRAVDRAFNRYLFSNTEYGQGHPGRLGPNHISHFMRET